MTNSTLALPDLGPNPPDNFTEINQRIWFADIDGFRIVFVGHDTVLYRAALDDVVLLRYVAVSLHTSGLARQEEIAAAFAHSVATLRRWERRYEEQGLCGLQPVKQSGRPLKITGTQEGQVRKWLKQGLSNREMARRLGVSEGTIRGTLKRLGAERQPQVSQIQFELDEEEHEPDSPEEHSKRSSADVTGEVEETADLQSFVDPLDRSPDRLLARLGLLEDADPVFAPVERLPRAGVLLAIPLLVESGLLEIFTRTYKSLGPAFYGLRTTVVCLFMLALLRIKRPENLKEHNPEDLGRLLGLDRAPEVKTLRRKLKYLASRQLGMELMRGFAEKRAKEDPEAIGILYCDGHVKEYHGKETIGSAYVCRRRLAAPGATDTWLNDLNGDPFFVVQTELNDSLSKCLEPVMEEVRQIVGDDREITVVFDRGGWSPKLFKRLLDAGWHIITYRKGHRPKLAVRKFSKATVVEEGWEYDYEFHDAPRAKIGKSGNRKGEGPKFLWLRQVTRLCGDGHQIAVITDRKDLNPEQVLHLMANRWRQENFFKYMREEFALDALLAYGSDPLTEDLDRPNPAVRRINKQIRQVKAEHAEAQQLLGQQAGENEESTRPTMRGFKIATAELRREIETAQTKIDQLKARRSKLPARVPASDHSKLKREQNLIVDTIKMCAYQTERKLAVLLEDSYARVRDDGLTLLHAAFQASGSVEIKQNELCVRIAPQSSPHRTRAIAALCENLQARNVKFPGSRLRLRFEVEQSQPLIV